MLDQKRLQEVLDYCPITGEFTWKVSISHNIKIGQKAGCFNSHYWKIRINRKLYLRSRLIWLYVYGVWPLEQIDHINLNKIDDRISNLREATNTQNLHNRGKFKNNKIGYKGVTKDEKRKRYVATICGKRLGRFTTPQEAAIAYQTAARQLYGEYAYIDSNLRS